MKILHLNFSDSHGGAARAAYRLHKALLSIGIQSQMYVCDKATKDITIIGPERFTQKFWKKFRHELIMKLLNRKKGDVFRSYAVLPSNLINFINNSDADVVNLHWINGEMLSIKNIGSITKPTVWTLHDMWAFLGAEHLTYHDIEDYEKSIHRYRQSFINLNLSSWVWHRKRKRWAKPIQIVCPSQWLASQAKKSTIMSSWPVEVVPNCIDMQKWKPVTKSFAREMFDLPQGKKLIMFGSFGSNDSFNKGRDLLISALQVLQQKNNDNVEIVIFGHCLGDSTLEVDFPCHYIPHLHDDTSLIALYNAVDVVVVPSRVEAFCQVASEAHACGVPVVAFNAGGLVDIVDHKKTGYLAEVNNYRDLANGISWVLRNNGLEEDLGDNARAKVAAQMSFNRVGLSYLKIYNEVLGKYNV